jgi:hypothetical protein
LDYFRKTKFRESSLVIVLLVVGVIYFTSRDTPAKEETDVQALIDAAVEQAVEEALSTTSDESTDKTDELTDISNLTPTISVLPAGYYWGQYSDGTWGIRLFPYQPENFEWAWDVFNREDPSGSYGYDAFDENSTLIGTLVDFDCSFNRISKTEEHKAVFGLSENTIEYYDTYLDWAEDNYDYLTEEAVITISQIMRGVWTCDYEYLESISTEYLDFVHSGDAYVDVPKFSDYIASFENNYNDDDSWGKYTYTLGALLYMTPAEAELPVTKLECDPPGIQWIGNELYQWPMESKNPKQLREIQVAKMSMFDNGLTKSLIDGTYQGDDGTYGFRLQITTEGIWKAYKYTGHTWPSGYSKKLPYHVCPPFYEDPDTEYNIQSKANEATSSDSAFYGEVNSGIYTNERFFEQAQDTLIKDARIIEGNTYDAFVIELEKEVENDLLPGPYRISLCSNETCYTRDDDEMGLFVPAGYEEEWLYIAIYAQAVKGWAYNGPADEIIYNNYELITSPNSNLAALFNGQDSSTTSEFVLGIKPGSTFRSYRTANPPTLVIEVEK